VKHSPTLIIFGMQHQEGTWRKWFCPSHLNAVAALPCEIHKSSFGRLQQWIHTGYRTPAQKIIVRPENHWKSVILRAYLTLIRSKSIVPRSRTSTNWNDAPTASGPLWVTRLLNVLMASGVNV